MKSLKNTFKAYKNYLKELDLLQRFIHFGSLIGLLILFILYRWLMILLGIVLLILLIYSVTVNNRFKAQAVGNGIIYGGRGAGKGLLLNKRINTDPNKKHFCNVPYNKHTELLNVKDYINSIAPNTTTNFIENNVQIIEKVEKFEGVNIYWDDVGVYAPNHMDAQLKKYYPEMSALLPINRHAYNAYMIITTQDIQRPYKLLRELQTDFYIKAINSSGWGYLWQAVPILSLFSTTKYIYYEKLDAAISGKLPFSGKGLINDTAKHGYLTAGQATKEVYEAENGRIRYGRIIQLKKNINYDTRYFHKVLYGKTVEEYYKEEV